MKPKKKATKKVAKKKVSSAASEPAKKAAKAKKPSAKIKRNLRSAASETFRPENPLTPEILRRLETPLEEPTAAKAEPRKQREIPRPRGEEPPKASPRSISMQVPPILLERDTPYRTAMSGPGERFSLGPQPSEPRSREERDKTRELPESYGTQRLWLTARDPHWIFASWDIPADVQKRFNAQSADGHLILRAYVDRVLGEPVSEAHVHPESRHWFIHVGKAGTRYVGELGYRGKDGRWNPVAVSLATVTPPDRIAEPVPVQFASIPPQTTFEQLVEAVATVVSENIPVTEAVQQLRSEGFKDLPPTPLPEPVRWTPSQASALAELVRVDDVQRVWIGSLEVTELVRRHLEQQVSSVGLAGGPGGSEGAEGLSAAFSGVSSPLGGTAEKPRSGFWFNINAELVLYGATEPNAKVLIGDREIKLRPDGSFSFRFALPDGQFGLDVRAISGDGQDGRSAVLRFERGTEYRGDVGMHPQDPGLKRPAAENVR